MESRRILSHPRSAFTLVELLVVIAILGLLASLLFPVFNRAKASALSTVCQNNFRQLGLAAGLYSVDTGRLPVMLDWLYARTATIKPSLPDLTSGQLFPYIGSRSTYLCPTEKPGRGSVAQKESERLPNDHSYVMNCMMCHVRDTSACLTPSKSLFFLERTNVTNDTRGGLMADRPRSHAFQLDFPHRKRAHLLMLDTHIESLNESQYHDVASTREFWYPNGVSGYWGTP